MPLNAAFSGELPAVIGVGKKLAKNTAVAQKDVAHSRETHFGSL